MSNHRYIEYTEAASAIAAAALITYAFLGWMLLAPATRAAGLEGETGFAVFFIGYLTTALLAVILALTIGAHAE